MPRLFVLDALEHPDADLLSSLGASRDPNVTWTRDPELAEAALAQGHHARFLFVVRDVPEPRVRALLARAVRVVDTHVLLTDPTPEASRALLRLGVHGIAAGPGAEERLLRGLPITPQMPVHLAPVDPARCEVRVAGQVLQIEDDPPAIVASLPIALPFGSDIAVVDEVARALGLEQATFRVESPVDSDPDGRDPHVWRLVPTGDAASRWGATLGGGAEGSGGGGWSSPGARLPSPAVTVAIPARWCSATGTAFEVAAHAHVRAGALVEVRGLPANLDAPVGVFGRVVRAEGTSTTRLRCEALPAGGEVLVRRSTVGAAPTRTAAPAAGRVEPVAVVAMVLGATVTGGLVWMALHREPTRTVAEPAASTKDVLEAVREAF
jgi:hypothetical protein